MYAGLNFLRERSAMSIIRHIKVCFVFLLSVVICLTLLYFHGQTKGPERKYQPLPVFKSRFDGSNIHALKEYVQSYFPHLINGEPKPLKGDVCQRFSKQPYEEKLFLKAYWGPTFLHNTKDVTFVTQLSYSRLNIFAQISKQWEGPISASVYVNWTELLGLFGELQTFPDISSRDNIALHVVLKNEEFYPVNFLRKLALNGSLTEYVYLNDVDFVPSFGSYEIIKQYVLGGLCENHTTLVVPSFEFIDKAHEYPSNKSELMHMWDQKIAQPFHWSRRNGIGQWSTNFYKWRDTDTIYKIIPEGTYEPFIVMKKTEVPSYREDFQGREYDKISFCLDVMAQGFNFLVLPEVFSIHMPHPKIKDYIKYTRCSEKLFKKLKAELREKYPDTMQHHEFHISQKVAAERKKIEKQLALN